MVYEVGLVGICFCEISAQGARAVGYVCVRLLAVVRGSKVGRSRYGLVSIFICGGSSCYGMDEVYRLSEG